VSVKEILLISKLCQAGETIILGKTELYGRIEDTLVSARKIPSNFSS
jgi:hypothetical protein